MQTRSPAELLDASMVGAGLLGGTANVIMQLARPAVGYGVVESTVDSGRLDLHPVKRTRTTITYLAVAAIGTDEERRAYRNAVNRSHAQVRSTETSPVVYNAFDPDLQLWVAACLYRGFADTYRLFVGRLTAPEAENLYQGCARLGTTLQLRPEQWPADRAAFEEYWAGELGKLHIDATVYEYLDRLVNLNHRPRLVRALIGSANRFVTTGFLPPEFRTLMRLDWSPRQQRRFDRTMRVIARVVRRLPTPVRRFPFNAAMWDLRRRIRTGRPLV